FDDLLSDLEADQLERFHQQVKIRWPDLFQLEDKKEAREILTDLVDQNLERLDAMISQFESQSDELARRSFVRIHCDDTPAGHRMRKYLKDARDALDRRMAKADKHYEKTKERDDWSARGMREERRRASGRGRATGGGTEQMDALPDDGLGGERPPSP